MKCIPLISKTLNCLKHCLLKKTWKEIKSWPVLQTPSIVHPGVPLPACRMAKTLKDPTPQRRKNCSECMLCLNHAKYVLEHLKPCHRYCLINCAGLELDEALCISCRCGLWWYPWVVMFAFISDDKHRRFFQASLHMLPGWTTSHATTFIVSPTQVLHS